MALQRLAVAEAAAGATDRARQLLELAASLRARHGLGESQGGRQEAAALREPLGMGTAEVPDVLAGEPLEESSAACWTKCPPGPQRSRAATR